MPSLSSIFIDARTDLHYVLTTFKNVRNYYTNNIKHFGITLLIVLSLVRGESLHIHLKNLLCYWPENLFCELVS